MPTTDSSATEEEYRMSPQHHTPGANAGAAAARPGESASPPASPSAPSAPDENTPGPAGAPEAESGTAPTGATGTTAAATASTVPSATTASTTEAPDEAVAVATAVATTPPGVTAGTGVGSGRPRKPILAGAAILGAALIAIPLLLAGSAKDEGRDTAEGPAAEGADTVLNPNDARAALDDYAAAQPSSPPAKEPEKSEAPQTTAPEPVAPAPAPEPSTSPAEKKPEPTRASEPEETKPPVRTAATAVQELAARSGGRHICYRVNLADRGWQKPVCDGAEAGTFGKDLPIKALNIASAGTKGLHGNGAHVVEGWKTGAKWATVVDGVDMYLGSTDKADSPLQGYTIMAVDGSVCQNAQVKDKNWMGLGCTKPGSWMYGGSPMELKLPLRAVRFTV